MALISLAVVVAAEVRANSGASPAGRLAAEEWLAHCPRELMAYESGAAWLMAQEAAAPFRLLGEPWRPATSRGRNAPGRAT